MSSKFELGKVYFATPNMRELGRRIVIPIGRSGDEMQLALLNGLGNGKISIFDGREMVQFTTDVGTYTVSSVSAANAEDVAIVNDILRNS